jgi:hypothetical protein
VNKRFDISGGGELGFDLDLASIWPNPGGKNRRFLPGLGYTVGIEGGLLFHAL